jgi:hypothetical protein
MMSAGRLRTKAWRFVCGVVWNRMIELEREGERGDPRREAWAEMPTR